MSGNEQRMRDAIRDEVSNRLMQRDAGSAQGSRCEDAAFGRHNKVMYARPQKLSCCNHCCDWCKSRYGCPYTIPFFLSDAAKQKSNEKPDGAIDMPCDFRQFLPNCLTPCLPCFLPQPFFKLPSRKSMVQLKYNCNLCAANVLSLETPSGMRIDVHELPWPYYEVYQAGGKEPILRVGRPYRCGWPSGGCEKCVYKCNDTYSKSYRRKFARQRMAEAVHEVVVIGANRKEQDIFAMLDTKHAQPSKCWHKLTCCCNCLPKGDRYATEGSDGVDVTTYSVLWGGMPMPAGQEGTADEIASGLLALHMVNQEGLGNGSMLYFSPCFCIKFGCCMKFDKTELEDYWSDSDEDFDAPDRMAVGTGLESVVRSAQPQPQTMYQQPTLQHQEDIL